MQLGRPEPATGFAHWMEGNHVVPSRCDSSLTPLVFSNQFSPYIHHLTVLPQAEFTKVRDSPHESERMNRRNGRDGETQVQRGDQTCLRSHSKGEQAEPEPRLPGTMLAPSPGQLQNSLNTIFLSPTLTSRGIYGSHTLLGELQLLQNHTIEGCCNSKKTGDHCSKEIILGTRSRQGTDMNG